MFSHLIENGSVATFGMVLLHTLWQGALICIAAALVLEWQRHASSAVRYGTYCIALMLLLVVSIATFAWSIPTARPTLKSIAFTAEGTDGLVALDQGRGDSVTRPTTAVAFKSPTFIQGEIAGFSMEQFFAPCASWVAIVWLVVVPLLLIRLVANYMCLRVVHLRFAAPAPESMQEMARRLCKRMRYHRTVRLLVSTRAAVPMVIGWIKPVVLLPTAFVAGVPIEQIEALLAHELAHLRRLDPLVNFLQCIAETVLFFNPAAWWLSHRIRIEREYCCDDLALAMGTNPTLYAESLLAVAENALKAPAYAMSSGGGVLLTRIKRILGLNTGPRATIKTGLLGAVIVVGLMLSVCTTYVLAQHQDSAITEDQASFVAWRLEFPADRSVGEVYFRGAGVSVSESNWDKGYRLGWSKAGPAQGTVIVPAGEEVFLRFTNRDMSILNTLPPDSVFRVECRAKDLCDEDVKPLASLTNLRALSLRGCAGLTDRTLALLKPLQKLESLQLHETGIQKLTFINSFKNLQELDLANSKIDDEGMANLLAAKLSNIERLCIAGASITEPGFASVSKMSSVKELLLGAMTLGDSWLTYLANASTVETLSVKDGNLNDVHLGELRNMKSLHVLKIPYTKVTDVGMAHVAAMPALEQIYLYGTAVTEDCLPTLATSRTLWEVESSNTSICYASLKEWRQQNNFKRRVLPVPNEPQQSTNPQALKVGIILSDFQATGPHWMPDPYGYQMYEHRGWLISLLNDANVDLYAVIEPGTEKLGELQDILAYTGLSTKTVDATNPADLLTLDVVCAWRHPNILPETVAALQSAVKQGFGLVCNGNVGNVSPQLNDAAIMDLSGQSSQEYGWWGQGERSFDVVNAHPILGDLKPGTKIDGIGYNGAFDPGGPPQGTLLIGPSADSNTPFYPLYLRDYGKGRIVFNVSWNLGIGDIPAETFYMRCVNWVAGFPVDSKY